MGRQAIAQAALSPPPESWFVDDVNLARYTGYTRNRSIWQIADALDPINLAARPAPVLERH